MKRPSSLATQFVLIGLALLIQPVSLLAQAEGVPTLAQTLRRLEKTLTRAGTRSAGGFIKRFDARDFRGCKITYELSPELAPDHKGYVPPIERTTIDLSTLDPQRVGVSERQKGAASVSFATRNDEPTIEYRLGSEPHLFSNVTRLRSSYFSLTNKAAAEEVREALVQAIELCKE